MIVSKKLILIHTLALLNFLFFAGPAAGTVKLVKGQTVYIPSYSNIISESYRVVLRANLIIHNTDPSKSITLLKIDHYDTNGRLVENYLTNPLELKPLAATRIIIRKLDKSDEGAGSNFIVQWQAQDLVNEPIIESIMIGSVGTQGHSFSSQGRIMQEVSD